MAIAFPALFSHTTDEEVTAWQVRHCGVASFLVPRMTRAGARELSAVAGQMSVSAGGADPDVRRLCHVRAPRGALSSKMVYGLLRFGGVSVGFADTI